MPKVKKTYRLDSDLVSELEEYAQAQNMSQTEALESAIHSAIQKPDNSHTQESSESDTTWKELFLQEHEKLLALTDKVADSLQAAQTLQAMDKPALESTAQKEERKTRWQRLKEAWRG